MASTPKQGNGGDSSNNNNETSAKKKKSRSSKGSYLSKWLDKAMSVQNGTPNMEYDLVPNMNWPNTSQFAPGYDPCRFMYGCPEPMSMPAVPTYYTPVPQFYSPDYHRYMQNKNIRPRRCIKPEEVTPSATPNSMNYLQPKTFTDSQDYASLPPIVTSVADTNSNSDTNANDKEETTNNNRRYSDPCVQGLPDVAKNGEVDSDSESGSDMSGSQVGSRLLTCLIDQITSLKAANARLSKDLMETRTELENIRQHNNFLKGSAPTMAAHSRTPLNNGLVNGHYSPGFLADLVREIRDAARVREEAMFARVRAMMLDRNDSSLASSEAKLTERCLEEIKSSLRASEADKRCMMDRIARLEEELRTLRSNASVEAADARVPNGTEDADTTRLRRELADMRKAKINADEHALKLERLVTQLRSKFNGLALTNGPESLPSDAEYERIRRDELEPSRTRRDDLEPSRTRRDDLESSRIRRSSVNSSASTVVFGPVTDL